MPPLRIGMFGGGTVGGGVYELLARNNNNASSLSSLVRIDKICVRSLDKTRDFAAPQSIFTTNPSDILENADIDCVVEVMGGTNMAKTVVLAALKAGKAVVTANKALLAEFLVECRQAALAAKQPLLYEAAVCGGIPIIHVLSSCYNTSCDEITSISGILNGTTNYMLTKMATEGADYNAVLQEAQDLGYAEADPTADVEGHDVRAKICLLAKLAFGTYISPVTDNIPCVGISSITAIDFWYAESIMQGFTIKLIGVAQKKSDDNNGNGNNKLAVYVSPVLLRKSTNVLAGISGAGNAIQVTSRNLGQCLYTGPGAGRYPTANSVVADILRLAQQFQVTPCSTSTMAVDPFPDAAPATPATTTTPMMTLDANYTSRFYVRVDTSSSTGVTKESMQQAFTDHGIVMLDREIKEGNFIMMETKEACSSKTMQAWCDQIVSNNNNTMTDNTDVNHKPVVIPIMDK